MSIDVGVTTNNKRKFHVSKKVYFISNQEVHIEEVDEEDMKLFHAGTNLQDNKVMTSGGRVFCATALGINLKEAQSKAYDLVNLVSFNGAFCRKDIGYKGIK